MFYKKDDFDSIILCVSMPTLTLICFDAFPPVVNLILGIVFMFVLAQLLSMRIKIRRLTERRTANKTLEKTQGEGGSF